MCTHTSVLYLDSDFSVIRRRIEERSSQLVEENHDYNVALEKLLSKITESQSHRLVSFAGIPRTGSCYIVLCMCQNL